jgi:hypothetical protein
MNQNGDFTTAINYETNPCRHTEYFQNQVDVVTHIGGVLGLEPALIKRGAEELRKEEENMSEIEKTKLLMNILRLHS